MLYADHTPVQRGVNGSVRDVGSEDLFNLSGAVAEIFVGLFFSLDSLEPDFLGLRDFIVVFTKGCCFHQLALLCAHRDCFFFPYRGGMRDFIGIAPDITTTSSVTGTGGFASQMFSRRRHRLTKLSTS